MAAICPPETLNPAPTQPPIDANPQPSNSPPPDQPEQGEKRKRPETQPEPEPEPEEPSGSLHPLWKTSLCSYFRRSGGSCSHGEGCRYAHGEAELRPRPDRTWDPTSERAKKLLKSDDGDRLEPGPVSKKEGDEVMMTEAVAEESCSLDSKLEKCLGILYKSAKKKRGMIVGFMSFETAEQVKSAVEELDGKSMGNKTLKVADVIPISIQRNNGLTTPTSQSTEHTLESASTDNNIEASETSNGIRDGDSIDEGVTPGSSALRGRSSRDVVTPLAHMSYVDQLEHKKNALVQMLKKLVSNLSLVSYLCGLPCKLEGIIESPLINGYRNKCEFSVGYSLLGRPTVGFLLGNFREGVTAVEEPTNCPNVSKVACQYAGIFQEFLQNSGLPIWNRLNNTGFWRQLTVREGRSVAKTNDAENTGANISEVMLMIQVSSASFDDGVVNNELKNLAQVFASGASAITPPLPLTALVVQDHKGISNVAPADAPLRSLPFSEGETESEVEAANDAVEARIHDYINSLRFRISPTAFFQVNTLAAEKLYSLAGDWAGLGPDTLLFDICCGTGTIGLTLAHHVGMVVGIEMNASAVSDAHRNAEINGIKNCRFVCAKAEDVMGSLLKEYLNPPQKPDEVPNGSQRKEITLNEGRSTSLENVPDNEDPCIEVKTGEGMCGCIENGSQELAADQQETCASENATNSMQQFKNVVAIVDPPRVGLHPTVIKALRTHPRLRRLVLVLTFSYYISCNPESLVANAIELCTPSADNNEKGNKNNRGWRHMSSAGLARHRAKSMPNSEPFQPIKAMAVDLFPHTPHCELVMLLER
ncbi:hypothetical protein RJ639_012051 [Escallonia herrerae]|uniref:C3H1-type domain-containing protein n=1 Tax=Escallonia herrerae TaxID=1293975 RepID=A0AA88VP10_9ASTE|nr:hypothetical protein RJ639_012051 [Escallonia herrerae]